jgi:hypothetical protein
VDKFPFYLKVLKEKSDNIILDPLEAEFNPEEEAE